MARTRALAVALVAALASSGSARAEDFSASPWAWEPSLYLYVLRDEPAYVQPTLEVNRGWLHLEGRYNYEELETGSVYVGWNHASSHRFLGQDLELGLTLMLGGVFGRLNGLAPAFTLELQWGPILFYWQGEYVIDLQDVSASFFYTWSELSVSNEGGWMHAGVSLQRTRVFQTATDLQVGPLLGFSFWKLAATIYLFGPGLETQYVVAALGGQF